MNKTLIKIGYVGINAFLILIIGLIYVTTMIIVRESFGVLNFHEEMALAIIAVFGIVFFWMFFIIDVTYVEKTLRKWRLNNE